MVQTISARDISLEELERIFYLHLVEDEAFFREWLEDLPEITDTLKITTIDWKYDSLC